MRVRHSPLHRVAQLLAVLACLISLNLLCACRSSKTVVQPQESVGQQLMDLDKALQTGAISQKEYDQLRKSILERSR